MKTGYITHTDCMLHRLEDTHPERPDRLTAIRERLLEIDLFTNLEYFDAPLVTREQLRRVHTQAYLDSIEKHQPEQGVRKFDLDTAMMPHTVEAISRAAGGAVYATDLVAKGLIDNAFCAIRPPGHHAEPNRAMGFCFYNNVAIAAKHALEHHELSKVSIVDFDAHHGNGTELVALDDPRIQYISTFQHPFYPFTDLETTASNIIKVPLAANTNSDTYRNLFSEHCLPALSDFAPEMIFISAGFDGHFQDVLSELQLGENDYEWITSQIMEVAAGAANNRIVSVLEGGYAFEPLARSAEVHVRALMQLFQEEDEPLD